MHMEQLRELLLSFPCVKEEEPFGPEVVVYKVMGKMFALVDYDSVPPTMNLKCDPERALDLRDVHEAIRPGWHMNKRHWAYSSFLPPYSPVRLCRKATICATSVSVNWIPSS